MIKKKANTKTCWWCGDSNLTGEHKFKKSDFVSIFGSGVYSGDNALVLIRGDKKYPIQSASSKFLKFNKCLCKNCNTNRSSEYDKSYELLIEYINNNENKINQTSTLNLLDIFGLEFQNGFTNSIKYIIKHLGCQIDTGNYTVSNSIIKFLDKITNNSNDVKIEFEHRVANTELANLLGYPILYLSPFTYHQPQKEKFEYEVVSLTGWYRFKNVCINYHYEKNCNKGKIVSNRIENGRLKLVKSTGNEILARVNSDIKIIPNIERHLKTDSINNIIKYITKIKHNKH